MTVDCQHCYENIAEDDHLIEYDEAPFHEECFKEMFREDNPGLSDEEYEEFDRKAEQVDKFRKSGNMLIPVVYEQNDGGDDTQ